MQSTTVTQPAIEKYFSIEKDGGTLSIKTSAVFADELATNIKAAILQHSPTRIELSLNPQCWIGLDQIGQAAAILHNWKRAEPDRELILKEIPACGITVLKQAHLLGAFQVTPPTGQEPAPQLVMPTANKAREEKSSNLLGDNFSVEVNQLGLKVTFRRIGGEIDDVLTPLRLLQKGEFFSHITLDLRGCNRLLNDQIQALPLYGTRLKDHGSISVLCSPGSSVPQGIANLVPRMKEIFHLET